MTSLTLPSLKGSNNSFFFQGSLLMSFLLPPSVHIHINSPDLQSANISALIYVLTH